MKKFTIYILLSISTVVLALIESNQHIGMYGFIAIFICQPWLGLIWIFVALGLPIPESNLNASVIASLSGLNGFIWGTFLFLKYRKQKKSDCK